jgi:hypothetical protein
MRVHLTPGIGGHWLDKLAPEHLLSFAQSANGA